MGLPVEVNNLMLGSLGGYTVGRSLRFRSSASAYLNRTPANNGNSQKFTWSGWVKRGTLSVLGDLFSAGTGDNNRTLAFFQSDNTLIFGNNNSGLYYGTVTTAVFRDPSAWYHIVFSIDTTQATTANRVRIYINNVEQTATSAWNSGYIPQNTTTYINTTSPQVIGANPTYGVRDYYDGYLAEVNLIDGQQLTPSSFGAYDTNGVWQPIKYTGTYGTNGFYLPFSNTTSTTTLVQDSSGNGNNWTPNNISLTAGTTYDSMIDSPTVSASSSNYCTWNPNWKDSTLTISDGNLKVSSASNSNGLSTGTIAVSSGKWYWEATVGGSVSLWAVGIISTSVATPNYTSLTTGNSYAWNNGATKYNGQTGTSYGATYTTGDVLGVALDLDGGTITFYKNNTSQGTAFTGISGTFTPMSLMNASSDVSTNFGQRPFTYTPPSGFKALNTYNLPAPSIANGAQYMAATLYTGNGSSQSIVNSQNNGGNNPLGKTFYADFLIQKARSAATDNIVYDTNRGANYLVTNTTAAEVASGIIALNSTGFNVGSGTAVNANGTTYVGWQWNAGSGSSSSNTSGSITSTVSANTTAGFSVVTWTGTGANATIGHGLGVAPSMIINKFRSSTSDWPVYHISTGAGNVLYLNQTAASASSPASWNNTAPTSSVFSVGGAAAPNGTTMVTYCFAAVRGYSAFGSYVGNLSTDGPMVYTGFRPRWIMLKNASGATAWIMYDTSRNIYNVTNSVLQANVSTAEVTAVDIDVLSNGFKIRTTDQAANNSGQTYIYAAFAENPFNYSRAR